MIIPPGLGDCSQLHLQPLLLVPDLRDQHFEVVVLALKLRNLGPPMVDLTPEAIGVEDGDRT